MGKFSDRLALALEESGRSRAELAAVLFDPKGDRGVSVQAVGQALNGVTRSLTAENAAQAARLLGVDLYWLCTGEGQMRPSTALSMPQPPAPGIMPIPPGVRQIAADKEARMIWLLSNAQRLDDTGWARLLVSLTSLTPAPAPIEAD